MSGSKVFYSKDEFKQFNHYSLKIIPSSEQYDALRKFISIEKGTNLSTMIDTNIVPTYLKNRYGDIRNQQLVSKLPDTGELKMTRRKIYVSQGDNNIDKINEEIRDILSKLSDSNKKKLFGEFMNKQIPEECGNTLIENIYTFSVDLGYLVHLYVELMILLKDKNKCWFDQLMKKFSDVAMLPMNSSDKKEVRLRLGNTMVLCELFKNRTVVDMSTITTISQYFIDNTTVEQQEYITLLCELLKKILPIVDSSEKAKFDKMIQFLQTIEHNCNYERKFQYMAQDVIELF